MTTLPMEPTGTCGSRLAALVALSAQVHAEIADIVGDPSLASEIAGLPADAVAGFVTALLSSTDTANAATTVLVGQLDAGMGPGTGQLVGGRYASTRRFLEVEGGLSQASASVMVARARDLRGDYSSLLEPWLTGPVTSDAVRVITTGVADALKVSGLPHADREVARTAALDLLLPVATVGTVEDVRRAIRHLTLVTNPDGATRAAMDAFADQSLTVEQVGAMVRLTAYLTPETAAAVMTVLTQQVDQRRRAGDLAPEEQVPEGVDPESWDGRRRARERYDHLLAIAFGEAFTALLDNNDVGSHHGIAPHVTVTVDVERFEAGLGGDLTLPGSDEPVLVPNATVQRILCDADITTVITRALTPATHDREAGVGHGDRCTTPVATLLLEASREVLYVGRAHARRAAEAAPGARGPRPALRVPRLPGPRASHPGASRPRVGARRRHRRGQHDPVVPAPSPRRARGRLDGHPHRRDPTRRDRVLGVHPARTTTSALTSRVNDTSPEHALVFTDRSRWAPNVAGCDAQRSTRTRAMGRHSPRATGRHARQRQRSPHLASYAVVATALVCLVVVPVVTASVDPGRANAAFGSGLATPSDATPAASGAGQAALGTSGLMTGEGTAGGGTAGGGGAGGGPAGGGAGAGAAGEPAAAGPLLGPADPTLPWTGASSTPSAEPGSAAPGPWTPSPGPSAPSFPNPSPTSSDPAPSPPSTPTAPAPAPALQPSVDPGTGVSAVRWSQVFGDEFTGTGLDTTRWNTGRFAPSTTADNAYNNGAEAAMFASSQVSVRGGSAVETIAALATPQTLPPYGATYRYTSGEINTRGTWAMRPGQYVEARIRVPSGDGLWPAFWLIPADGSWPPETDIFEFGDTLRHPRPTFNYHYAAGGQSGPSSYGAAPSYVDAFHTYGVLWSTSGLLTAYLDGAPVAAARADSTKPMYVIINLGCLAGHSPASGSQLLVDWVRAWTP